MGCNMENLLEPVKLVKFQSKLYTLEQESGFHYWFMPQKPFKPKGITIYHGSGIDIIRINIGSTLIFHNTTNGIPCQFFSMRIPLNELKGMVESGQLPKGFMEWPTVEPGMKLEVFINQAIDVSIVVWGWEMVE